MDKDSVLNEYATSSNRRSNFILYFDDTLPCNQKAWGDTAALAPPPLETMKLYSLLKTSSSSSTSKPFDTLVCLLFCSGGHPLVTN